jgi:hypothetical protein
MIRDPSDGTVRETPKPAIDAGTSGLPIDRLKTDEIERLERARDWLKSYFHRKPEAT